MLCLLTNLQKGPFPWFMFGCYRDLAAQTGRWSSLEQSQRFFLVSLRGQTAALGKRQCANKLCVLKEKKSNIWLKHFHTSFLNYDLLYARLKTGILTALKDMRTRKSSMSYVGPLMTGSCKYSWLLKLFYRTHSIGCLNSNQSSNMAVPLWSKQREKERCVYLRVYWCLFLLSRWIRVTACSFWRDVKEKFAWILYFSEGETEVW